MNCQQCNKALYSSNRSGLCADCIRTDPAAKAKRAAGLKAAREKKPDIGLRHKHIPPHLRAEYMRLRKGKGYTAAEVTAMLRKAHPQDFEDHEAIMRANRERKESQYTSYRIRILPSQLHAARRKVAALENEARRLGLVDLL